ncbi:MAG: hypothetical protein WCF36_08825 [Candidatus Nanopelagicales bacterium]
MAVIALTSVSGAPGVTTTILGLGLAWHRPALIVEADVTPGSAILAGYCRGVVPHDQGIIDVALAAGLGEPVDEAIADHVRDLDGGLRLLAGVANSAQVGSVEAVWGPLAAALRGMDDLGVDVLVDAGRLGAAHGPMPLLRQADLVGVVLRADLPSINAARGALGMLGEDLDRLGLGRTVLHTILVGPARPYTAGEVSAALGTPMLGDVAWDPASAAVLSTGAAPPRGSARSPLTRSISALASRTSARLAAAPTTKEIS